MENIPNEKGFYKVIKGYLRHKHEAICFPCLIDHTINILKLLYYFMIYSKIFIIY